MRTSHAYRYGTVPSLKPVHHKCFVLRCAARGCCSVSRHFAVCHKIWLYRRDALAAILPKKFKLKKSPSQTIFRGDVYFKQNDNGLHRDIPKSTGCRKSRLEVVLKD